MHEWGFGIKRPRMKSMKADEKEQQKFIEEYPEKVEVFRKKAEDNGMELKIIFTDEAGIRRDGTIHYGWYKKGCIAEVPESGGRFESRKLIGAVDPVEGKFNLKRGPKKITTDVYASFLKDQSDFYHNYWLLVVHDGAPWHGKLCLANKLEKLGVHNIDTMFLPKYSPKMNPCEKFWNWMRETVTHCRYYENMDELDDSILKFYKRAYNQREKAKIRFKTEIPLQNTRVKASGICDKPYGIDFA